MTVTKTEIGLRVMKDRSVTLTPRQRSAFILFDGKRSRSEVKAATAPTGVTEEDIDKLFELGLLADTVPEPDAQQVADAAAATEAAEQHRERTPQQRYADAYPIATQLTAGLGLRGLRLNLAVEAATSYEALRELAPKIREAVGPGKFAALSHALEDDWPSP
jgi:hypothetical protein